ncbi:MAG TPA: hypothetical protein VIM69_03825 [Opitutaceae bacterium]
MRFAFFAVLVASAVSCRAWDYPGHRAINLLAVSSLPPDYPVFARTPEARERIGFLAGEPDRWRNTSELTLRHENGPDHFFDMEWMRYADITPETLTPFRYVFDEQLSRARREHPERFPAIDPTKNHDETHQQSGFLPWTIVESYARLRSAFSYLKAYEQFGGSQAEIRNAQENVIYFMGVMGHYVGDASQPLHLTENFNGWASPENPHGYTTSKTFHAWIDGGFFQKTGGISFNALAGAVHPARLLETEAARQKRDPIFTETVAYLMRQYAKMTTVYELEKAGKLSPENPREGRAFLDHQLVEGAEMLGSLWYTAYRDAPVDEYVKNSLEKRAE